MAEVTITFCVPCRYQQKAMEDADALLKEFGLRLHAVRLVPGDHGVYDVAVDDRIVFSLDREMRFPGTQELVDKVRRAFTPTDHPS